MVGARPAPRPPSLPPEPETEGEVSHPCNEEQCPGEKEHLAMRERMAPL